MQTYINFHLWHVRIVLRKGIQNHQEIAGDYDFDDNDNGNGDDDVA